MGRCEPRPQSLGEWNAYVEAGESREERRRRLAECPERWREQVRKHVEICFSVKRYYKGRGRQPQQQEGPGL